jgi:hypothetical protein
VPTISAATEVSSRPWRAAAGRIVEELFPVTQADAWDALLDLRGQLLHGSDWSEVLEVFLSCRLDLEEDHYLPFYRLRRLLAGHLRLENAEESGSDSLAVLLRSAKRPQPGRVKALRLIEQA